jgi:hypothetical protein
MNASQPVRPWRAARVARRALTPPPTRRRVAIRLFFPLTPIALLFAPFALLLALLCMPIWPVLRVNPFTLVLAVGRLLFALGGTDIHIDTAAAFVRVRIF